MQTLLKGSFSLLAVKSPLCSLKLSACNIHIFFKMFDSVVRKYKENKKVYEADSIEERQFIDEITSDMDFPKCFNFLYETIRGLLIFAKEGEFDKLFVEDGLITCLADIILKIYCENFDLVCKLLSKVINKKVIRNDDIIYDLMNYIIGTIKCFT